VNKKWKEAKVASGVQQKKTRKFICEKIVQGKVTLKMETVAILPHR